MSPDSERGLLQTLIDAAGRLPRREVLTLVDGVVSPVAWWQCDLSHGDVTEFIDCRFFDPGDATLRSIHRAFIERDAGGVVACFASFLQLARLLDDEDSDGED